MTNCLPSGNSSRGVLRALVWAAVLVLVAVFVGACGSDGLTAPTTAIPPSTAGEVQSTTKSAFPLTIKDSSGTEVTIPSQPRRIISFSPGMTEALFAIGAGQYVVATDQFSDYPEEANRVAKLDYSKPEAEKVVALQPDLVFMAARQEAYIEQLRKLNIRVLYLAEPETIEGVIAQIKTAGRATGHEAEAEQVTQAMQRRIDRVAETISTLARGPRVFMELDETGYTAGPQSFIGSMVTILKAQNIAEGAQSPFPQLSREIIVQRNPEVIVLLDANYGETPQKVRLRPGWANIAAVRTARVYPVDPNIISRPGPRVVDGLEQLAKLLYPDRFP